ncbi:MAG TPA: sigma-70 family RNA polymerase sigma factor [Blastocatellia bacterium]|nr:sigma-70 family RNA polymerase sigma factor [Blastocatellia bacterium]
MSSGKRPAPRGVNEQEKLVSGVARMLAEEKAWLIIGLDGTLESSLRETFETSESSDASSSEIGKQAATPSVTFEEASLITRLRAGEMDAFAELVNQYQPIIFSVIRRMMRDEEEARDITQETFLKIYRHFSHFRGESSLKTWIFRVAINQAHNSQRWWRRRRRDETSSLDESPNERTSISAKLVSSSGTPESQAIAQERRQQLERALAGLKQDFRLAVILRDIEGLAYEEIAEILEISIGTVKSRIARGREMLRASLSQR